MNRAILALVAIGGLAAAGTAEPAEAQFININNTEPCFLKYNLTVIELWEGCGISEDWLETIILPWEWITGGYLSAIIVAMIIWLTWLTYRNALYPLMAGILFLPTAWFLFPEHFIGQAFILLGAYVALMIYYVMFRQTKEY